MELIISIIILIVLCFLTYTTILLNYYINKNYLRYHLFDEEGENNGKTDTR